MTMTNLTVSNTASKLINRTRCEDFTCEIKGGRVYYYLHTGRNHDHEKIKQAVSELETGYGLKIDRLLTNYKDEYPLTILVKEEEVRPVTELPSHLQEDTSTLFDEFI